VGSTTTENAALLERVPAAEPADGAVSCAVVDDRRLHGHALAALLADTPDFRIAQVTTSAVELLRSLASGPVEPDLVVLCVHSPPDAGTAAVQLMSAAGLDVLVLRHDDDGNDDRRAARDVLIDAGARGVLTTGVTPQEFADTVRAVATGKALDGTQHHGGRTSAAKAIAGYGFTDAELPILGYVAAGLTDRQIAERTGKKISTVQNQMDSIASKIRARRSSDVADRKRRALLADIAAELGLV
jgi:DNA-binding NarL/FixJ family response regulator